MVARKTPAGKEPTNTLSPTIYSAGDDRFRAQFMSFPLPTYVWHAHGDDCTLIDYNSAAVAGTRGAIAGLRGRTARDVYADQPEMLQDIARCLEQHVTIRRESKHRRAVTGEANDLITHVIYVPPDLVMVHVEDITERKRVERALRTHQEWLAAIVDSSDDAIVGHSLDGIVQSWNRGAERLLGYTAGEAIGSHIGIVVRSDRADVSAKVRARLRRGEHVAQYESELVRKDGSGIEVSLSLSSIRDVEGRVIGIAAIARDISTRKQALRDAEQGRAAAEELSLLRQRQAEEAEAMAQVTSALSSALEPAQLYQQLLDQFSRILPCDHACVLLHQDGWVTMAGSWGRVARPANTRLWPVADLVVELVRGVRGKPALIRDTATIAWIAVPPFTGDHTIRSVLVVPLVVDGAVVGTFNVDSFTPNFYTERHLALAVTLAERLTHALQNARLYEVERQRAHAAEELARLRDDFVASVSHELRTPLTAIVGYAEILQARWASIDETRKLDQVRKIVSAANRQQRLVEDLLLLSRLELGALQPRHERVPLRSLVQRAADEVQGSYRGQRIDIEGLLDLRVDVDAERTVQVLVNLLDNAAKYSPDGSPVTIRCAAEDTMAVIFVRDHGPGVPETGREHLFMRFGRVPGSRTRAGRVGTGLGLYLSRQLAQVMGGTLDLYASGPEGSTFRLRLPRADA